MIDISRNFASAMIASAMLATGVAHAADLTVEIKGIAADKGNVMVALYKATDSWMKTPSHGSGAPAKTAGASVRFRDLAEGDYAVSLYVDENGNGKMDTNVIGIPIEPYAFSNNASGSFGPPSFEQAKFSLGKDGKTIVITLK